MMSSFFGKKNKQQSSKSDGDQIAPKKYAARTSSTSLKNTEELVETLEFQTAVKAVESDTRKGNSILEEDDDFASMISDDETLMEEDETSMMEDEQQQLTLSEDFSSVNVKLSREQARLVAAENRSQVRNRKFEPLKKGAGGNNDQLFAPDAELLVKNSRRERYIVLYDQKLGSGGYGSVYKAFDSSRGSHVAMKECLVNGSLAYLRSLETEFAILKELEHPNIVKVIEFRVNEKAKKAQIFMEWMASGSVQKVIQERAFRLPESVIRRYLIHALRGLAYLHEKKVLHRDIKPGNMLVSSDGVVKLSDFGTSKTTSESDLASTTNHVVGTCAYLAPEVIREGTHSVGSDLWALGCSVVEMGTGQPPWSELPADSFSSPMALMFNIANAKPPHHRPRVPCHLSAELQGILEVLLAARAKDRRSAQEILDTFPYLLEDAPLPATAETFKEYQSAKAHHGAAANSATTSSGRTASEKTQGISRSFGGTTTFDMVLDEDRNAEVMGSDQDDEDHTTTPGEVEDGYAESTSSPIDWDADSNPEESSEAPEDSMKQREFKRSLSVSYGNNWGTNRSRMQRITGENHDDDDDDDDAEFDGAASSAASYNEDPFLSDRD